MDQQNSNRGWVFWAFRGIAPIAYVFGLLVFIWLSDLRLWSTFAVEVTKFAIMFGCFGAFRYASKKLAPGADGVWPKFTANALRLALLVSFMGDAALLGVLMRMSHPEVHKAVLTAVR